MDTQNTTRSTPIINCHTHIFTGDHVPPYLAKAFVFWPLYYLFPLSAIVSFLRYWYTKGPYTWQFKPWYKNIAHTIFHIKVFLLRNKILKILRDVLGLYITIHALFIIHDWLHKLSPSESKISEYIESARTWMSDNNLLLPLTSLAAQIFIVCFLLVFVRYGRNLIFHILKQIWKFLGVLPGKQTKQLAARYVNIGRFARYEHQKHIFEKIQHQYPEGTGFIVLPMDMEYMDAGKVQTPYREQMKQLAEMKATSSLAPVLYPFVFVDPRRIVEETDYFKYHLDANGKIILDPCFIKEYIETHKFSGFKIYPALGYYPFDEHLLAVWRYAADNQIPIITHCIRGTIFYRGSKKKEWDTHPVFEHVTRKDEHEPLRLPEIKNLEFINNFTHPLNYLCLLEEELLRRFVGKSKDKNIRTLFGYTNEHTPLTHDLKHLKICFAHFGGDDEWKKFFESDRDNYASQLVRHPDKGIDFVRNSKGEFSMAKLEQIWKHTDWYSIICSMMLQYPNVYSDISYILHDDDILPLLKHSLRNEELKHRILYGTDFYVVRNHKSDKNMLADMLAGLTEEEFAHIAVNNPRTFLNNTVHLNT